MWCSRVSLPSVVSVVLLVSSPIATAQNPQPFNPAFGQGNQGFNQGLNNQGFNQGQTGQQGGGANADFEGLMELIRSTVAPESWAENGGGEAEIRPFVGGVYADATGVLRRTKAKASLASARSELSRDLDRLRGKVAEHAQPSSPDRDARQAAALRCVSLTRLEREIARRIDSGESLDESMLTLAGLRRVEYIFVYPDSKEIAIAGPAGDWRQTDERRLVAADTGLPVVRLDDLLTLLRRDPHSPYGCSIDPRAEGLAKAQAFLSEKPIPTGKRGRDKWLEEVCVRMGTQDLTYQGIAGDSRIACVLGEADYHMKLIGMGLADGAVGLESYLDSIRIEPGDTVPEVGAVRWWFGMNYTTIETNESGNAFAIVGQGVKLMSENEALAAQGQRIPTGQSDEHAQAYATAFTQAFDALCDKYAVYAELRNVFDLSLVAALLQEEELLAKASWRPGLFTSAQQLPLPSYQSPRQVETVANLRVVNRRQLLAGVSGGVWARPAEVIRAGKRTTDKYGPVTNHRRAVPEGAETWWWDGE